MSKNIEAGNIIVVTIVVNTVHIDPNPQGRVRMAKWLRYWTLNHEIVDSSPAIH